MVLCAVVGCNIRTGRTDRLKDGEGRLISVHLFPRCEKRKKLWLKSLNRKNWVVPNNKTFGVCSIHFNDSCFTNNIKTKLCEVPRQLTEDATPTLFLKGDASTFLADKEERRTSTYLAKKERRELVAAAMSDMDQDKVPESGNVAESRCLPEEPDNAEEFGTETVYRYEDSEDGERRNIYTEPQESGFGTQTICTCQCSCGANSAEIPVTFNDSIQEPDPEDADYLPPSQESTCSTASSTTLSLDDLEDTIPQSILLVCEDQLLKLFHFCWCGSVVDDDNIKIQRDGSAVKVTYVCLNSHESTWNSQKVPPGDAGNSNVDFMLCCATLFTGNTFATLSEIFECANIQGFSESKFYRIQRDYLCPVIRENWNLQSEAIVQLMIDDTDPVCLAGDCTNDSPGYSAKYAMYSLMECKSGLILQFRLMQRMTETGANTPAMEKKAFEQLMDFLLTQGLEMEAVCTDRHLGIGVLMREKYSFIEHNFDPWHLSASIKKRLVGAANRRGCEDINTWIRSITNHFFFSIQRAVGNPTAIPEIFSSLRYHIVGVHTWLGGNDFHRCEHDDLDERQLEETDEEKAYLEVDSLPHQAVCSIVEDKRLLKDILRCRLDRDTSLLESYHSIHRKYAPKRQHFFYESMYARCALSAMEHNANIGREPTGKFAVLWSRISKQWVAKTKYAPKQYTWRAVLVHDAFQFYTRKRIPSYDHYMFPVELPANIAPQPRPPTDAVIERRQAYRRFPGKPDGST